MFFLILVEALCSIRRHRLTVEIDTTMPAFLLSATPVLSLKPRAKSQCHIIPSTGAFLAHMLDRNVCTQLCDILVDQILQVRFPSFHFYRHIELIERILHYIIRIQYINLPLCGRNEGMKIYNGPVSNNRSRYIPMNFATCKLETYQK